MKQDELKDQEVPDSAMELELSKKANSVSPRKQSILMYRKSVSNHDDLRLFKAFSTMRPRKSLITTQFDLEMLKNQKNLN